MTPPLLLRRSVKERAPIYGDLFKTPLRRGRGLVHLAMTRTLFLTPPPPRREALVANPAPPYTFPFPGQDSSPPRAKKHPPVTTGKPVFPPSFPTARAARLFFSFTTPSPPEARHPLTTFSGKSPSFVFFGKTCFSRNPFPKRDSPASRRAFVSLNHPSRWTPSDPTEIT